MHDYVFLNMFLSSMGWMNLHHFSCKLNNVRSLYQGLLWDYKVLPCLAEKCGMNHYFLDWSYDLLANVFFPSKFSVI